jgi:hypothetical protein
MSVSGWDNAINRMCSKYRANIQNHVIVHLKNNLKKYFDKVEFDISTSREKIYNWLLRPLCPVILHQDDFEFLIQFRQFFKMEIDDYFPKTIEYDEKTFGFAMFLVKHGVAGTYLPISTIGRKYCYLDAKILRFMLPNIFKSKKILLGHEPSLTEMLEITSLNFNSGRTQLRKRLRKHSKKRKVKKKWRKIGHSKLPENTKIYSCETDGVGLSLCIHKSINLYPSTKPKLQNREIKKEDHPVIIGMDLGRAKAYAAAISSNPIKKPESLTFTRRKYYFEMKHRIRKRFENTRSQQPHIKNALQALALTRNFNQYLVVLNQHYINMKNEYLIDKERALWRMRLYRLKTRSLDKAVQRIFEKADGRPIVLGVGDAKFPSTGPGEKSMPTTQFVRAILKAKYRYHNKVKLISIHEFRTTMCCCGCGQITSAAGRRLRLCTSCNEPNVKLRDRDIQAARNILWLTQFEFLGAERPEYLSRSPKPRNIP